MEKRSTSNAIYYLVWSVRLLVSLLFIFSGLIKANDPVGFSYKLIEYFDVFGLHVLNNLSVGIAILICSLEIILGALLLLGFWSRKVVWGLLLLIIFFTFLTFYSAFFEVVTSCGCFGDAIPLSPWQSFIKDCILLVLIAVLFYFKDSIVPIVPESYTQWILTTAIVVISIGFGVYTYNFLPIIDFLPYKKGNHIPSLMTVPEGEALPQYETIYHFEKKDTQETKKINDQEYLESEIWKDERWQIIGDPETRLVKAGYIVPITDLVINDADGINRTDEIIENPDYNLIIVAYDLEKTNLAGLAQLNELARSSVEDYRVRTVLLTASPSTRVDEITESLELYAEVFYVDAVPLKSMIRSNPGLMLLKDGVVLDKWHHHILPSIDDLADNYFTK